MCKQAVQSVCTLQRFEARQAKEMPGAPLRHCLGGKQGGGVLGQSGCVFAHGARCRAFSGPTNKGGMGCGMLFQRESGNLVFSIVFILQVGCAIAVGPNAKGVLGGVWPAREQQ
jgi:hypothetical protein